MKAAKKLIVMGVMVACGLPAIGAVQNEGAQSRNSASERVPLVTLVMPALQQIADKNRVAAGCFALLSNPTLKLTHEAEVKKDGRMLNRQADQVLSEMAGKIIGCTVAIASHSDELSKALRQSRPTREQALALVRSHFDKRLTPDYEQFQARNQAAYDVPVMVAKDNNGHSKEYVAYNDVEVQIERQSTDVSDGGGFMTGSSSGKSLSLKTIIDGGENTVKAKAGIIREIITGGVFSFYSNPTTIDTFCKRPNAAARPCQETYSVKFDGSALDVRKNGVRWLDSEFLGGSAYAIELSGEKTTGTTRKVER